MTKEVLDELLSGVENADDLRLMKELKVRLMERMLGAKLTNRLGYEPLASIDTSDGDAATPSRILLPTAARTAYPALVPTFTHQI